MKIMDFNTDSSGFQNRSTTNGQTAEILTKQPVKRVLLKEMVKKKTFFSRKMELPDIPFNKAEYIETASGNR